MTETGPVSEALRLCSASAAQSVSQSCSITTREAVSYSLTLSH